MNSLKCQRLRKGKKENRTRKLRYPYQETYSKLEKRAYDTSAPPGSRKLSMSASLKKKKETVHPRSPSPTRQNQASRQLCHPPPLSLSLPLAGTEKGCRQFVAKVNTRRPAASAFGWLMKQTRLTSHRPSAQALAANIRA